MSTLALDRPIVRTMSLNVLLCAGVVAIPALSHALALPLYRLEPMRLLLFTAILFSGRRNALVMAVAMPLVSFLTSGHPVFPKVLLIQGELVINTLIFFALCRNAKHFAPAAAISVLVSKIVYYGAKFILIKTALMDGRLVATPWPYQLMALSLVLVGGGWIYHLKNRDRC